MGSAKRVTWFCDFKLIYLETRSSSKCPSRTRPHNVINRVRKRPNRRAPANVWRLQTSRALYGSVSPGKTCPLRRRSAANLNKIFNVSAFSSATVLKPKWIFKAAAKFPRGRTTVYNLISVEKSALFPHDDDDLYCCVPPCSFLSFYFFFLFFFLFRAHINI